MRSSFEASSDFGAKLFNEKLVEGSDGLLVNLDWRDVDVLAVATTHTVTSLNCVAGSARGLDENLCIDGRLSKDNIVQQFPYMAKPLEEGFEWVKIRKIVVQQVLCVPL